MGYKELIELLKAQMEQQRVQIEQQQAQMEQQKFQLEQQNEQGRQQIQVFLEALRNIGNCQVQASNQEAASPNAFAVPSFSPFDPTSELWTDYHSRFLTFIGAHSVPENMVAQVFLTNQSTVVYKLLQNLAAQQQPPVEINTLPMGTIVTFMSEQYDPKRFVVRERYKFWSDMQRKPGESIQELAARIRQDAITCDFSTIKDPQDEAMCTRFICSVNNEAVLKAVFKEQGQELTFAKAIQIAIQTEDAAKVANETAYNAKSNLFNTVNAVKPLKFEQSRRNASMGQSKTSSRPNNAQSFSSNAIGPPCGRCGKKGHTGKDCYFKEAICHYCNKKGHTQTVCFKRKRDTSVKSISVPKTLLTIKSTVSIPRLECKVKVENKHFTFEVDTGASDNFMSESYWLSLERPDLQPISESFLSASGHDLPVLGIYTANSVKLLGQRKSVDKGEQLQFIVTTIPHLNLLGRDSIATLGISVDSMMNKSICNDMKEMVHQVSNYVKHDMTLQSACEQMCQNFPDVFKPELGCLKDFELDIRFKNDTKPIFCKPRPVPFALQNELAQAYEAGIKKGVWKMTQFNDYGTPVVPVRKNKLPGQESAGIRVCGGYSVTVNPQLETHRQPLPLPEELMHKLGGGYGFTKIDLADAYNQIPLSKESQKKLALSTHKGVFLQMRLPFGISSAPGYFQEIMFQLTNDLKGVAVYLDDILVSGATAEDHLQNLRALLQRLQDKGLRCRLEKCIFAQPSVEYLGHQLSQSSISKSTKVDAVLEMPPPKDVPSLRSFLGSVQFYSKFLPNLSTITDPIHKLTRKGVNWGWNHEQKASFNTLKEMLSSNSVLAHFDPSLPLGISCDASNVGIGAVLFHRFPDGSERPVANASKTLTDAQRKYSQIQKEALSIVFALQKFHQYLYGR